MKIETQKNDVIFYPEDEKDILFIGKISTKIKNEILCTSNTFEPQTKVVSMKLSFDNLIELLINSCSYKK